MLSLGRNGHAGEAGNAANSAALADAGGVVLPRFLRKPARHFLRLFNHGIVFRPRIVISLGIVLVAGAGIALSVESGLGARAVAQATAFAGFKIEDVEISGVKEVSRIDVLTSIDLGVERSLFSFDVHIARDALRKLPWVSEARVAKAYPDRILIDIVERSPIAVWQSNGELWLVERDGARIAPFDDRFAALPLVVGAGAAEEAAHFVALVARHPLIASRVKAHVRIGERRWNLVLENGVTVLLPAGREDAELTALAKIEAENALLSRDIGEIDMRMPDRLVVRLTPQAAERRKPSEPSDTKALAGKKSGKET